MRWKRAVDLKDRAFFLSGPVAFSCSPSANNRIRGNRVYYSRYFDKSLYWYDIDEESIYVSSTSSFYRIPPSRTPLLVMPDIDRLKNSSCDGSHINKKEEDGMSEDRIKDEKPLLPEGKKRKIELSKDGQEENNSKHLLDFPFDVLSDITQKLSFFAYRNFGAVSVACKKVAPRVIIPGSFRSPWLLHFQRNKGMFNLINPKLGDRYTIQVPECVQGATLCDSKEGWLLLCKYTRPRSWLSVNLVNPFTKDVVQYPDLSLPCFSSSRFGFSSPPTSSNCVIVVVTFI